MQVEDPRKGWSSSSSTEADSLCAGRHLAQKGIPELTTDAAQFGTDVHKAFETSDDSDLNVSQDWILERATQLEGSVFKMVFPDAETYKKCDRPFTPLDGTPLRTAEWRFWYDTPEGLEHSGQVDVVYTCGDKALILDLKSLRGLVAESPRNMQLRDLAVLAWYNIQLVTKVYVAIIQPMVKGEPMIVCYDETDIAQARKELDKRLIRSNDPNSRRIPGEVQCKFCRAFFRCIEGQIWLKESLPATTGTKDDLKSKALALPLDKAVELWRKSSAIKTILDANCERLKSASDEELAAVGLKKKPGVSRDKIVKPNELYARLQAHNVTVQEYTAIVGVPKGKFQELVKAKTGCKGKSLDKLCDELLDGLVETTVGAQQLEEI